MVGDIVKSEVFLVAIEMARPFSLGFGTLSTLPRVFLRLEAETRDGIEVGYGEASIDFPFVAYDTWDILWALRDIDLVGRRVEDREQILTDTQIRIKLMRFPAAFAALNMALDDLVGRYLKQPLVSFYGTHRSRGQALASLPFFTSDEECLRQLQDRIDQGFLVKLKGGQGVEADARMFQVACQFLSQKEGHCAIDFNAGYRPEDFQALVNRLVERHFPWATVLFLEQPTLQEDGIDGLYQAHDFLRSQSISTPVMADESFVTVDDARECSSRGILLNFKIQKIGGIFVAAEIERAMHDDNLPSMVGGTFPTAIGRAYDQHAATVLRTASLPSPAWVPSTTYLAGDRHLIHEDFVRDSTGSYGPFSAPGLGVTVNESLLQRYRVDDPQAEYEAIRNDRVAKHLKIQLRDGASYRATYEGLSGRPVDWNFGAST